MKLLRKEAKCSCIPSEIVSFRSIWFFRTTQNSRKKSNVIHSATLLLFFSFEKCCFNLSLLDVSKHPNDSGNDWLLQCLFLEFGSF